MDTLTDNEKSKWYKIIFGIKKDFGKKPDMHAILLLIGMNELGQVKAFDKQEKVDLMHIATCKLLSFEGYYTHTGHDKDGWPQFTLNQNPPYLDLMQQENQLKRLIIRYFDEEGILEHYA